MKFIPGLEGYLACEDGRIYSQRSKKFMTPSYDGRKYQLVCVRQNGKAVTKRVHRLVASAFIPNPENKEQVNHINGIKEDNRVENLEWATQSENQIHAHKTGLKDNFTRTFVAKSRETNSKIVLDLETGIFFDSVVEAAKAKGVNNKTLIGYLGGFRKNKTSLVYA